MRIRIPSRSGSNPAPATNSLNIPQYDDSDGWYDHQMGPINMQSNVSDTTTPNDADQLLGPGNCGKAKPAQKRVVILEFGQPRSHTFGAFYDFYRKRILPHLGGALTGNRDAYDYLESSTARFPSGEQFVAMMRESAPFETITMRPLTFGIAWLYCGIK